MVDKILETMVDIEEVTSQINQVAKRVTKGEENVKIGIEKVLSGVAEKFGLKPAFYEYTFVDGGRADALYGRLIIEYEDLDSLQNKTKREHSIEQLKGYIIKHSKSKEDYRKHLGVAIDGKNILFVRFNEQADEWREPKTLPITIETVGKLLEALRGLRRKPLDVELMLHDFGPNSNIAKKIVQDFYKMKFKTNRSKVLFDEWKRVFKQAAAFSSEKAKGLENMYEINNGKIDYEKLIFSIHTYYAFLMKIIAAEVVALYGQGRFIRSFFDELFVAQVEGKLKEKLDEIENGKVFRDYMKIENFMEADYFSWYIDEWNEIILEDSSLMIDLLSNYEVATTDLKPEKVQDLFKRLYQKLMPKEIRQGMGEFYTPDWLAEILLDKIDFRMEIFEQMEQIDGFLPQTVRLLDPACGSGTFLVLAIKRLREYADEHFVDTRKVVRHILRNIVGFDLNPLAVIAARTNYLLALGDLLREMGGTVEIPVFLADSIMVERSSTLQGESFVLRTVVGDFQIPISLAETATLTTVLELIARCVNLNYEKKEFETLLKKETKTLSDAEAFLISELYQKFKTLEDEGKNKIWTGIIKNSFAPLYQGKFDYVIGNPPWISWESLPENYRKSTQKLWFDYGLVLKTDGTGLGRIKKDLSMLFTVRSVETYLAEAGKLAFFITWTVFKNQAGGGFRNYLANRTQVILIDEMVDMRPFENATNRTALLILKKGQTKFPIVATSWEKTKRGAIEQDASREKVIKISKRTLMSIRPIGRNVTTPWLMATSKTLESAKNLFGKSSYKAREGVVTALNGAFWLKILDKDTNGVLVENLGDISWRKKVKIEKGIIEKDFIYPLLRGVDVRRWTPIPKYYILMPSNPDGSDVDKIKMKTAYPRTYSFLDMFFTEFVSRMGEPYKSKLKSYRKMGKRSTDNEHPYYYIFNAKNQFAEYKVAWNHVSGAVKGKGEFNVAVISPYNDKILGVKTPILDHGLMFINCSSETEAHYMASVLNSSVFREVVKGYTLETHITTDIVDYLRLPVFDKNKELHILLADKSKEAHRLTVNGDNDKITKVENQIDKMVEELLNES